jgi:hypothetical protein
VEVGVGGGRVRRRSSRVVSRSGIERDLVAVDICCATRLLYGYLDSIVQGPLPWLSHILPLAIQPLAKNPRLFIIPMSAS